MSMNAKNENTRTLDQFKDKHYGKTGTAKRDELDAGYENFNCFFNFFLWCLLCFLLKSIRQDY